MASEGMETYWSLVIEPGWVQSAIWYIEDKTAHVVALGSTIHWGESSNLIEAADTSLSSAVQELSEEFSEPSKTVFGVPPSWVADGQIKREHLDQMRDLCGKLSLSPSGFVVLPEAIAHFLKSKEGAPSTSVILGIGQAVIDVSVFRLGNLSGTVNVTRSASVVDDVVEGLARFASPDPLPSRFLLYDSKKEELEDVRQLLVTADWTSGLSDKVKFLHTPQVEIIDPKDKILAVCLAGGSEISPITAIVVDKEEGSLSITEPTEGEQMPESFESAPATKPQDIGFFVNQEAAPKASPTSSSMHSPLRALPRANLGKVKGLVTTGLSFVNSILRKVKLPKKLQFSGNAPFVAIVSLLVIIIIGILAWWFLPKAKVTVFLSAREIEKQETLTIGSGKDINAKVVSSSVSGDKTANTSGSKTVGDKAKSSVTIRNGTAVSLKLTTGTILLSSGNLKFSLDQAASVSAALSPSSPGTATLPATAEGIGADYNLAKGEVFKVANYPKSDVDAVAENAFVGGSSRSIVAVAKTDMDTLEKDLIEELLDQGRKEIGEKLSDTEVLIPDSSDFEVTTKTFNHKIGDEAANLKLTLSLKINFLVVNKKDILDRGKEAIRSQVPSDYSLLDDQMAFNFQPTNNNSEYDVIFKASLLPEVNTDQIKKKIAGKYPSIAQEYLKTINGFEHAEIKFSPSLPGRLGVLPHISGNIAVEVQMADN